MRRWLRQLPNVISSLRILLIVPIAFSLAGRRFTEVLWLFGIAAVSDGVDGFLARRFGWQTELGGMLDPVADKLMLATAFVMLAVLGLSPKWLSASVIARDGIIVLGAVSYRVLLGPVPARPTGISKVNTVCQILYVLDVIAASLVGWPPPWVTLTCGALAFVTVVVSGIDYVLVYGRRAAVQARTGSAATPGGGSSTA